MAVVLAYLPAFVPKEDMDKFMSYLPESTSDIVIGVALCGLAIAGSVLFYMMLPWPLRGPARQMESTADETVVVIGGGYGTGPEMAKRFRDYLFNVAIVDLRDTDGKELPAESRRTKKNRDKDIIKEKKARERARQRAKKKGYKWDEEALAVADTKRDIVRNYKCDPSDADALEEVKKKIEIDFGTPTIVIWAYTPSLHEVHDLFKTYSNTLSVFLPSLKASYNGGMFITLCSSLAHIRPAPTHLKPLAEEYKKILDLHRSTDKNLKDNEKRWDVKAVMVELGHFDERMINVGLYFPDKLGVIKARVLKQKEEAERLGKPMAKGIQIRNNSEKDAVAAMCRQRTCGLLMRTSDDEMIAKEIFDAVRDGHTTTIYKPNMAALWEWINRCPRSVSQRIIKFLGVERTAKCLLTCEFTEGEEGLLVGLEADLGLEDNREDMSASKLELKITANNGTVLNLFHERQCARMGSLWFSELMEFKTLHEKAVKKKIREGAEKEAREELAMGSIERLERKVQVNCEVKSHAQGSMAENN
ncbi:Dicer-like protein 1 [Ascosphaera pollenicola]|nr:Dicer-like protein 1 [Ascosphaera pollenicola]